MLPSSDLPDLVTSQHFNQIQHFVCNLHQVIPLSLSVSLFSDFGGLQHRTRWFESVNLATYVSFLWYNQIFQLISSISV